MARCLGLSQIERAERERGDLENSGRSQMYGVQRANLNFHRNVGRRPPHSLIWVDQSHGVEIGLAGSQTPLELRTAE